MKHVFLASIFFVTSFSPVFAQSPVITDPNFSPSQLSAEAQIWHNRLIRAVDGRIYPDPFTTNDLYGFGRTTGMYIHSMAVAARATKDPRFIAEIAKSLDHLQSQLKDAWPECGLPADGILNFVWLADPNYYLYCTDDHLMDDMMTHASIAYATYTLQQNTHIDPSYSQKVDFWTDYLENHYLKKHLDRAFTTNNYSIILNKYLTHPYQSSVNFFYYMYRLTNNPIYLTEAQKRAQNMNLTFWEDSINSVPVLVWRHRPMDYNLDYEECQIVYYADYTIAYSTALALDSFDIYNQSLMTKIANSVNQLLLPNSNSTEGSSTYFCGSARTFTTNRVYNITSPGGIGIKPFMVLGGHYTGPVMASIWQLDQSSQDKLFQSYLQAENRTEAQLDNGADLLFVSYPTAMLLKYSDLLTPPSPTPTPTPQLACGDPCTSPDECFTIDPENPYIYWCYQNTCVREDCIGRDCTCTPPPDCPTDINQDGITDITDFSILSQNFFSTNPSTPRADINQDGIVDLSDFSLLSQNFLHHCL